MELDAFDLHLDDLNRRIESARTQLLTAAGSLSANLGFVARRLNKPYEDQDTWAKVNTLGEVQGSGAEIDRLCGELGLLIEMREKFVHARRRYDEDAEKAKSKVKA
jgi:hypothetical protein